MKVDKDLKKAIKTVGILSTVGMAMAFAIAIGALAGYYADRWLGTAPLFLLIGIGLGIGAAFRNLFVLTKRARREENN
ncbi:MAG TPA: AtpZ/AtpI family protein [Desulfobacteraceae bacterium]|nr:AtpZ/AtpI family protein [Desulfobacteraceae bacterium]